MTEEKKRTATVLAVVLVVAILCSLCASLYSAKGSYDLKTEANAAQETTEDNVKIMNGEYEILSTTQISDAYKSGNTSGLSEKNKETLEMAKAVLDEVITDDMTTAYDKEKAIYDWMTSKLNYDTGVLQGTWTFDSWDKDSVEDVSDDVMFTGTWAYAEATADYTADYQFVAADESYLPSGVTDQLVEPDPADTYKK